MRDFCSILASGGPYCHGPSMPAPEVLSNRQRHGRQITPPLPGARSSEFGRMRTLADQGDAEGLDHPKRGRFLRLPLGTKSAVSSSWETLFWPFDFCHSLVIEKLL